MANKKAAPAKEEPKNDDDDFFGGDEVASTDDGAGVDDDDNEVLDLEGVDENAETEYPAIPNNVYPAEIIETDYGISNSGGNKMITWVWEVCEGEYKGSRLWYHTVLKGNGLVRLKKLLVRIGPDVVDMKTFKPKTDHQKLVGLRGRLDVTRKHYQGKLTNNVKDVLAPHEAGSDVFED